MQFLTTTFGLLDTIRSNGQIQQKFWHGSVPSGNAWILEGPFCRNYEENHENEDEDGKSFLVMKCFQVTKERSYFVMKSKVDKTTYQKFIAKTRQNSTNVK